MEDGGVGDQSCLVGRVAGSEVFGVISQSLDGWLSVVDVNHGVVDEPLEDTVIRRDLCLRKSTGGHLGRRALELLRVTGSLLEPGNEFAQRLVCTSGERGGCAITEVGRGKLRRSTFILNDAVICTEASVDTSETIVSATFDDKCGLNTYLLGHAV